MTPRSSATTGIAPSSRCAASNAARPGPAPPASRRARRVARRAPPSRPTNAAEVVDARQVDELEGAPEARRPTSGSRGAAAPASRRSGCPRAARSAVGVGRHAGDHAVEEQLRLRLVVGASGRDVDRHVADEAHPAPRRRSVRSAPHSRSKRTWSAHRAPPPAAPSRPRTRAARGRPRPPRRRPPRAGRSGARATRRTPTPTCTGEP